MHAAEEPALVFARGAQLVKIGVEPRDVRGAFVLEAQEALDLGGGLVGDDVIDLAAAFFNVLRALGQFRAARIFAARPQPVFKQLLDVGAFAAAHGEIGLALDRKDLTAHEVVKVAADVVRLAAAEHAHVVFVEQVKALVRAVDKADVPFLFAQTAQRFFFRGASVPHKAEIAADDERIAFFELDRLQPIQIAVEVAGDVYHISRFPFLTVISSKTVSIILHLVRSCL